jgi:hypothetical protein
MRKTRRHGNEGPEFGLTFSICEEEQLFFLCVRKCDMARQCRIVHHVETAHSDTLNIMLFDSRVITRTTPNVRKILDQVCRRSPEHGINVAGIAQTASGE